MCISFVSMPPEKLYDEVVCYRKKWAYPRLAYLARNMLENGGNGELHPHDFMLREHFPVFYEWCSSPAAKSLSHYLQEVCHLWPEALGSGESQDFEKQKVAKGKERREKTRAIAQQEARKTKRKKSTSPAGGPRSMGELKSQLIPRGSTGAVVFRPCPSPVECSLPTQTFRRRLVDSKARPTSPMDYQPPRFAQLHAEESRLETSLTDRTASPTVGCQWYLKTSWSRMQMREVKQERFPCHWQLWQMQLQCQMSPASALHQKQPLPWWNFEDLPGKKFQVWPLTEEKGQEEPQSLHTDLWNLAMPQRATLEAMGRMYLQNLPDTLPSLTWGWRCFCKSNPPVTLSSFRGTHILRTIYEAEVDNKPKLVMWEEFQEMFPDENVPALSAMAKQNCLVTTHLHPRISKRYHQQCQAYEDHCQEALPWWKQWGVINECTNEEAWLQQV